MQINTNNGHTHTQTIETSNRKNNVFKTFLAENMKEHSTPIIQDMSDEKQSNHDNISNDFTHTPHTHRKTTYNTQANFKTSFNNNKSSQTSNESTLWVKKSKQKAQK